MNDLAKQEEVWLLVLAAGFSTRMGSQKLLLNVEGESLVRYLTKRLLTTKVDGIVIITNSAFPEVKAEVKEMPVVILENNQAQLGMSTSLKRGIAYLMERHVSAAIVVLADQPEINVNIINSMANEYRSSKQAILQAHYLNTPSHPVLFSSRLYAKLLEITGDNGAKQILRENRDSVHYVHINEYAPIDIDTLDEYQAYLQRLNS